MSRIQNAGNATELAKPAITGCVLVDLNYAVTATNPTGPLHLSDGFSEVVYLGHTYSPLGQFAGIEMVVEALDTIARPIKLTLSGVDANLAGLAQQENYQNREVVVYVGLIDQASGGFVAAPEIAWEGRMDFMTIDLDAGFGKITLNSEHRLRREPRIARYTDVDQQLLHPGDTFLNFINTIAGFKSQWGDQKMTYGGPTGVSRYKYPWTYRGGIP